MKTYIVTYTIKANGKEEMLAMTIQANNKVEACKECKRIVREDTGRNAFTPKAYGRVKGMTVDTLLTEISYRETVEEAKRWMISMDNLKRLGAADYVVQMHRDKFEEFMSRGLELVDRIRSKDYEFDPKTCTVRDKEVDKWQQ